MAKMPDPLTSAPLESAWAELAAGRWDEAMALFEAAVATEETAEALEGLSWAAWWRDDAETVFSARGGAYRLYKRSGDATGAARMATWLACDELDFNGAFAVASGWLRRAHRLLDGLDERPEHGWLAFFDGYLASASGETARTLELAGCAARVGRRLGVVDLEMLGLALEGATRVACAEFEDGMRCLDEATVAALEGEAAIPIAAAWACCFMVSACSATRDYERAFEWCDRIAAFAARYGSRYMLAFCRAEYGAVHLWRGRWAEAERVLEASVEDFSRSRPAMVGAPLAGLAELRRRQGRGAEATALLERAGSSTAAHLCRARQAVDQGDGLRAAELLDRLVRQAPEERKLGSLPALELLIRVRAARGELNEARVALEALRELGARVSTEAVRASGELAEGRIAAAAGEHDRARTLLEDAVDRYERCGAPFEAAEARVELATTLLALGRTDLAEGEAEAALERLLELGAEPAADAARRLLEESIRSAAAAPPLPELTPREREVLGLVAHGLTNRQIAERLVVSEHTVHRHVTNILRKLRLPSRTAAAAQAVRSGLAGGPGA